MTKEKSSKNTSGVLRNPAKGKEFDAWDPKVLRRIDELVALADVPGAVQDNRDLVREIIVTALKTHHSQIDRGDVKILSRSLREMRYGFRVFKEYRHLRKVTMFGSARTPEGHAEYQQARQFARRMSKNGYMVITGGGPGIMEAGNEGAGPGKSFGINIRLPFEQGANKYIATQPDLYIDCRFFFTRKLFFLKETSAAVFFPGGFGTLDEAMEVLTLVQTGKSDPMPIVFISPSGSRYWSDLKHYMEKHLLKTGKILPADLSLFYVTNSVSAAAAEILRFYKNYHSKRYVGDDLVIRLQRPLPPAGLKKITERFADICQKGGFHLGGALPEENEYPDLPRLVFRFKRMRFGRLRQLIDVLNTY
ncbi:MAG TPA: LOG family protein [Elusimicrobiota bacterium]|nr:LOG family protein [Elusimicrobiota bacterium]